MNAWVQKRVVSNFTYLSSIRSLTRITGSENGDGGENRDGSESRYKSRALGVSPYTSLHI